ncbi:MAG: MCE family protein [Candidatus Omnitrophica bacterium]|nr:MCE family protein [Candidatus Omnitrophota bacterium]
MESKKLELVVGTFVFFGFIILFVLIFFVSGVFFFKQGYHINVVFNSVIGIASGAPVKIAGVQVGQVDQLSVRYNKETGKPEVVLKCFLDSGVQVHEHSPIYLRGTFALSEPHVNIESTGNNEGPLLKEGDTILGTDPVRPEELLERGKEISYKLEDLIVNANKIITDPTLKEQVKSAIKDFSELMASLNDIFSTSKMDIKGMTKNMNESFAKMNVVLQDVSEGKGTIGKFVKDDTLYTESVEFVRDLRAHPWRLLARDDKKGKFLGVF